MINLDRRILDKVNENELYLLCHIAKYINKRNWCFPARETLRKSTGYGRDKLDRVLKSLCEKGILKKAQRRLKNHKFSTNKYTVTTSYIGVFVSIEGTKEDEPLTENQYTEPLTGFPVTEKPVTENQYTYIKYCKDLLKHCKDILKYCESDREEDQIKFCLEWIKNNPASNLTNHPPEESPQVAAAPPYELDQFIANWDMKFPTAQIRRTWECVPDDQKHIIAEHVPKYMQSNERRFLKEPLNYLKTETWLTPIIDRKKQKENEQSGTSNDKSKPKRKSLNDIKAERRAARGIKLTG